MGDLTKNFSFQEFTCKCGCTMPLGVRVAVRCLATQLQFIREVVGRPIIINSGYRCEKHNKNVGGASGSLHLAGLAADIRVTAFTPTQLGDVIRVLRNGYRIAPGGLSVYNSFVHYDIRGVNIDF